MMSLRLTELAELLANEDITQQEHDEARRSALGIVKTSAMTAVPASSAQPSTLEDEATTHKKKLKQTFIDWIGDENGPMVDGQLHDVLGGGTEGDEFWRKEVEQLKGSDPLRKLLATAFFAAGKGVTPPSVLGNPIAMAASREWLRSLAAAFCGHICWRDDHSLSVEDREKIRAESFRQSDDSDTSALSSSIMSAVAKGISTKRSVKGQLEEKAPKLARVETTAALSTLDKKPAEKSVKNRHKICAHCEGVGHEKDKCPKTTKPGKCTRCGGKGHYKPACPSEPL